MTIQIAAVGGYGVVGRNMTAIRYNNEVVIVDCGIHLPNYVTMTEGEHGDVVKREEKALRDGGAIPDDRTIQEWWPLVKAITCSHAHLDHMGALPYCESKYDAPIILTPFAAAVLNAVCRDEKIRLRNSVRTLLPNSSMRVSESITIEFIHVTHSTPQTVIIVVRTPEGSVVYGSDFKLDNSPTLGKTPNYESLKSIPNVRALLLEDLYSADTRKMPSEAIAQDMLRDVLFSVDNKGKAVVVTTFSSHIARLKAIAEIGNKLGRKVVFMGRSLAKYSTAAEEVGIAYFSKLGVQILRYGREVRGLYRKIADNRDKYLLVMTGHQGEPNAMLSRVVKGEFVFKLKPADHVIFSCFTIPADVNKRNRAELERQLRDVGVRMFTDIHVSGHCAREDLRDVILMTKPACIIPVHGEDRMNDSLVSLAQEQGYETNKNVHVLREGQRLTLQ